MTDIKINKVKEEGLENEGRGYDSLELPAVPVLEEIKSEKEMIAELERSFEEFEQKVLDVARTTRVTAGGKQFSFRVALVIGNKNGMIGFGIAKGLDVAQAVEKAFRRAKKNLISIPLKNSTIPHDVKAKFNSAVVFLKPVVSGTGVKAGGVVRVIAKLAGIKDLSGKIISRTNNKINIAKATIKALKNLKSNAITRS